jgi:hypothetical protein
MLRMAVHPATYAPRLGAVRANRSTPCSAESEVCSVADRDETGASLNQRQLRHVLDIYVEHYNQQRSPRARNRLPPLAVLPAQEQAPTEIHRHDHLGVDPRLTDLRWLAWLGRENDVSVDAENALRVPRGFRL